MQEDTVKDITEFRAFLDANAWIDLLYRTATTNDRIMFWMLAQSKVIDVVLSANILEELSRSFGSDEQRRQAYTQYIEQCTKDRVLLPLVLRMAAEWLGRRELHESEQFLFVVESGWLQSILDNSDWNNVAENAKLNKQFFNQSWKEASKRIFQNLQETYSNSERTKLVEDFEDNILDTSALRCKLWWQTETDIEQIKTFRTNMSHRMYEQIMLHSEQFGEHGHNKGDSYDQTHFADARATRCKYLVTSDRKLSEICKKLFVKLQGDSPEPISTNEFLKKCKEVFENVFSRDEGLPIPHADSLQ